MPRPFNIMTSGFSVAVAELCVHPDTITLRVKDQVDDRIWVEFEFSASQVNALVALMEHKAKLADLEEEFQATKREFERLAGFDDQK